MDSTITSAIPGYANLRKIRFISNDRITFKAFGNEGGLETIRSYSVTAPDQTASGISYLALGDSFSSGEGSGAYLRGTVESGVNTCHTSTKSYPYQIANFLGFNSSQMKTVACSGAISKNVLIKEQYPTLPANNILGEWLPGYKTQIDRVVNATPSIVTMNMGGNDVDFKGMIATCVKSVSTCFSTREDRLEKVNNINNQFSKWVGMYKKIKENSAPGAKVYIVGYPKIAYSSAGYACGFNVMLDQSELEFSDKITTYLNYVISQAAASAGVVYVNVENSLSGSKLCETNSESVAVNGLTQGNDTYLIIDNGSYHPNALGQKKMYDAIKLDTDDFTKIAAAPNTTIQAPKSTDNNSALNGLLLNAPSTSRPLYDTMTLDPSVAVNVNRGQTLAYSISGIDYGLKPNTSYNATIFSTPTDLGNFMTDSDGNLTIAATVPTTVETGLHTLSITGLSLSGENVNMTTTAYIKDSDTDYDGDGIVNAADTCPYFVNSSYDSDQDGIDDACDGTVGIPPLYRARNGNASLGEDASYIYVDRNTAVATSIGINDYNPDIAEWVTVAHTTSTDKASSQIASFSTEDALADQAPVYERYVPNLSTRTVSDGCVTLTPLSLSPITQTSGLSAMQIVSLENSNCRTAPPEADTDSNGVPDNQQGIYRARNGISDNGEDFTLIYVERSVAAAEAALGISDYDSNADGWAVIGVTDTTNTGIYSSIALLNSNNTLAANDGKFTLSMLNTMDSTNLRLIKPQALYGNSQNCAAVTPVSLDVVKRGYSRAVDIIGLISGQSCI